MSRPLLFVHPHMEIGGAERQTVLAAKVLADRGWKVGLVVFEAKGNLLTQLPQNVEVHDLGIEQHALALLTAVRLRRLLNQLRPVAVVSKLWSSNLVCELARRMPGAGFQLVLAESLNPSEHVRYIRLGRTKRTLIRQVYRSVGQVACNSEATAAAARTVYGPRIAYAIVPPGVALFSGSGVDRAPLTTGPTIVSVGALRPLKGHRDLVEALAQVADLPWSWTVIGDGPEREDLAQLLDRRGLRGRVTFTGEVPDPSSYIASADLLLHGAKTEGFGAVVIEALSVGTPVIAADAPGPVEILRDGGGWVFRRGDTAEAARLLRVALTDPHQLPSQHTCRQIAARYSIERSVDALEALLNPVRSR